MPKSAPRRKRIRTARAEADPINLPESKVTSNGGGNGESSTTSGDRSKSAKKSTAGQEREKHLGPVLDKVCYVTRSDECTLSILLTRNSNSFSRASSLQILQMIDYGQQLLLRIY